MNSKYPWILSLKMVLISTGVLSMGVFVKVSVPVVSDFIVSEIPSIWSCFVSWLRPPYLYLLINCIIISIVASSKLHHKLEEETVAVAVAPPSPMNKISSPDVRMDYVDYNTKNQSGVYGRMKVEPRVLDMDKVGDDEAETEAAPISSPMMMMNGLQRKDSVGILFNNEMEKPPVSSRIGQRKSVKPSPEGKALGVSKPKRHDTLESTWRTITEGRSMPLTRHLKKSDTWDSNVRKNLHVVDPATPPSSKMKKSETFNDRTTTGAGDASLSPSPGGSGKLRREPSLTQDELNRRVEAFIKKFNDEMRLQRQESLKQYQEMMGRGAH